MCVNDAVLEASRGSLSRINDKCKDLQLKKADKDDKSKKSGCPYVPPITTILIHNASSFFLRVLFCV